MGHDKWLKLGDTVYYSLGDTVVERVPCRDSCVCGLWNTNVTLWDDNVTARARGLNYPPPLNHHRIVQFV